MSGSAAKQLDMFAPQRGTIEQRFAAFDREHPRVWQLFERFALELVRAGRRHYSADAVLHRVRWETDAGSNGADDFKINNDFAALYSRKWTRLHPEHAKFFRTRERRAA